MHKLYEAAKEGVAVSLIIRGIFCPKVENKKFKIPIHAISIVDQFLEHGRVFLFKNLGKDLVYISSADFMVRNLDHRLEAALLIQNEKIKSELIDIINIQLQDNVKARKLNNSLSNEYAVNSQRKKTRSQLETYNYLSKKLIKQ